MQIEKEILVCYDVENNKKRTKFYKEAKKIGLFPIQKSVMWGMLNIAEIRALKRLIKKYIDPETDKAFMTHVNFVQGKWEFQIGHANDFKPHLDSYIAV